MKQFSHKNGLFAFVKDNASRNDKNQDFQNQLIFLKSVQIYEKALSVTSCQNDLLQYIP